MVGILGRHRVCGRLMVLIAFGEKERERERERADTRFEMFCEVERILFLVLILFFFG